MPRLQVPFFHESEIKHLTKETRENCGNGEKLPFSDYFPLTLARIAGIAAFF
jgi:hypothetical protein